MYLCDNPSSSCSPSDGWRREAAVLRRVTDPTVGSSGETKKKNTIKKKKQETSRDFRLFGGDDVCRVPYASAGHCTPNHNIPIYM